MTVANPVEMRRHSIRCAAVALSLLAQASLAVAVPLADPARVFRSKMNAVAADLEKAGMLIVAIENGTIQIARRPQDFCHTTTTPEFTRQDAFALAIQALVLIEDGRVQGTPVPIVAVPRRSACWQRARIAPASKS